MKRKARRLKLLLIIVAHPRKIEEGIPDLYSISGSANWYNKCDHGIIVYRALPDDWFIRFILGKSKDHETMGLPGEAIMTFDRNTADYIVESTK